MPEAELRRYTGTGTEPADFDAFWHHTLQEARRHPIGLTAQPVATGLTTITTHDITFAGWGGHPVRGWLHTPAGTSGALPAVVEYIGYNGGRGLPIEKLLWASAGYAHLVMDSRAQGAGWSAGETADPIGSGPSVGGNATRGILSPQDYYYRRLITDAVRAVDAAQQLSRVDPDRIVTAGHSQGGGLALVAASLVPEVAGVVAREPFLCDLARGATLCDEAPFADIARFLRVHPDKEQQVLQTLAYVDAVNHARRGTAPAWISVALMDTICPPSGIYAAHHHWSGPKELSVWRYGDHEGGGPHEDVCALEFVARLLR
ncbi:acetylxylan esterase [Streptomyces sp. NPDC058375]|uniref:acetylxylan esterase n=1 Tax=Streptomyces sp. NPDC058375 TaxID=3346467 RepID=UPI0036550E13